MLKCQECGELLSPMAVACPVCGTPVPRAQQAAPVSPVAAQQPVANTRQPADQGGGNAARRKSNNPLPFIIGGVCVALLLAVVLSGAIPGIKSPWRAKPSISKEMASIIPTNMEGLAEFSGVGPGMVGPFNISKRYYGFIVTSKDSTHAGEMIGMYVLDQSKTNRFLSLGGYFYGTIGKKSGAGGLSNGGGTELTSHEMGPHGEIPPSVNVPVVPRDYTLRIACPPTTKWTALIYQEK